MLSLSWRTLSYFLGLLLLVAGPATSASAQQSIQGGAAQPGDIICLAAVQVSAVQALHVVGNAFDPNTLNPVVVKWVVFDVDTNIRLLKVVDSQVNQSVLGNGDHYQSCINNNSTIAVTFNLSQTVQ
ncbi:MAG TPA: hypothetical protein VKE71_02560 [Candidatus Angelobacter sp.]|nr:hypothetical protein [Candidatus Angelobacter sp.]